VRHDLTAVVWQPWQLDELETAARAAGTAAGSVPVHLEIDTGMSRQGITPENLGPEGAGVGALLGRFTPESPLRLEGVMTHLFAADEADGRVTEAQLACWTRRWERSRPPGSIRSGSMWARPPRFWPARPRGLPRWALVTG